MMPQKGQSGEEKKISFYSIYSHLVNAASFTLSVSPFSRSLRLSRNCLSHLGKPIGLLVFFVVVCLFCNLSGFVVVLF